MPFLSQIPIIGQLFRSDAFRAKKSDLIIFVTPVISDPELAPNTDLLARADRMDQGFRKEYGNPEPLIADQEKATRRTAPRQTIESTPALLPAPIRGTPLSVPLSAPIPQQAPAPVADSAQTQAPPPIPVPVQPRVQASAAAQATPVPTPAPEQPRPATTPPVQPVSSQPPAGVADALRMLTAAQQPPAVLPTPRDSAHPASEGKLPPEQVGVLGNPAN
jgi:pilus assembly protein CpaC